MSMEKFEKEFDAQIKSIEKPNLMVIGGTGVGKSSLINKVFGQNVAKVGVGEPVTKGCVKYSAPELGVNIFDTEGYEIEPNGQVDNSNFQQVVLKEIQSRKSKALQDQIHIFWYCLSISGHRITDYDLKNIKLLLGQGIKLAIVLTKCDQDELNAQNQGVHALSFKKILKDNAINNPVFETMTEGDDFLELNDLVAWSLESLPGDQLRKAFIAAQKINLPLKEAEANKIIMAAAAAASTAAGLNPVPLSDAVILAPIQMGMAATLANTYGFSALGNASIALLKAQVLTMVGKQMASSLLKLIPVIGNFANAAVAGALTAGFGYALHAAYKAAYLDYLNTGNQPNWAKIFENIDITEIFNNIKKDNNQ